MSDDMMRPSAALLVKLGSIAVHAEEAGEPGGHEFDRTAMLALLADPEVVAWRKQMASAGFLPLKRSSR